MTTIQGVNLVNRLVALQLLGDPGYLSAFEPDQVRALAMFFFHAHESVVLIWGLFFALHLAVLGYLVFKSGYIPRLSRSRFCALRGFITPEKAPTRITNPL